MRVCLITFRSVTPAQRGEGILRRAGVACDLQRTPRWMEAQGCGYSLRLQQKNLMVALELLRNSQLPFRKVYLRRDNGTMEEMAV